MSGGGIDTERNCLGLEALTDNEYAGGEESTATHVTADACHVVVLLGLFLTPVMLLCFPWDIYELTITLKQ